LRVVLDTNLYVSALWNPQGVPAQVVVAYQAGRFTLVASTPMLVEVETVLRRAKFARRFTETRIIELLHLLQAGGDGGIQVVSVRAFVRVLQLLPPDQTGQPPPGSDSAP
jgi:predicted nucleic acid-binding protein